MEKKLKKNKNTKTNTRKKIDLKNKIAKIKPKKINHHSFLTILFGIGICGLLVLIFFMLYIVFTAPDFDTTKLYNKESTILYYANGEELAVIGNKNGKEAENRIKVNYDDFPQVLIDALVATEDSRFFQHNGFDAARFFVASVNQMLGKNAGGASTLTMQLAKNNFSDKEFRGIKGIIRKFTDIYMSIFKIEKTYTKEEIIEFYLNSQWLGTGNIYYSSINGVEQACQTYFGKSVNDLTLAEASLLVGMFNNPDYYNPVINPNNAKARQKTVLSLMVNHGYITEDEAKAAADIPIKSLLKTSDSSGNTTVSGDRAFIDYVLLEVERITGENPRTTPMKIYTTLNKDIQDVLNDFENGKLSYKFANDTVQNGIAVTSVKDGSIVGMSGGRNYKAQGTNRATVKQQPGSTAKPIFDYGPLIEYNNASTGTIFFDEPYTYSNGGKIKNYDNAYKGLITMRDALIDSRNIPALQAFQQVDRSNIAEFASSLLNTEIKASDLNEADAIGGSVMVSPLQMSAAYATFARGGYYIAPYSFTKITYLETEKDWEYKYTKTRVMSEETAYMVTDILVDAGRNHVGGNFSISGTEFGAKGGTTTIDASSAKVLGVPSNTTPNHWNNVFSPDYSISLWYGYDSVKPEHYLKSSQGSSARKAIMKTIAPLILPKNSKFTKPSSVVEATVEFGTIPLQLASEYTPSNLKRTELFKRGTEPSDVSQRFDKLEKPTNGNYIANGTIINLSWTGIPTPSAINNDYLQNYFTENYKSWSEKYLQQRISYNAGSIGNLGYQVYLDNNGSLTSLGFTPNTSYTYMAPSSGVYKFVIKASYSIFKTNMSDGLTITVNLSNNTSSTPPSSSDEENTEAT